MLNEPPLEVLILGPSGPAAASPAAPPAPPPRFSAPWLKVLHISLILATMAALASLSKVLVSPGAAAKSPVAAAAMAPVPEAPAPVPEEPKPEPRPAEAAPAALRAEPAAKAENGNGHAVEAAAPNLEELQVTALLEEAAELERQKPAEAAACYAKVIDLKPARTELWKDVADLHRAANDARAAARAYRLFLQFHPGRADALNNLGVLEMHQGRAEEAEKCFEAALKAAPGANLYFNLGNLHLKRNDEDRAAAAYRRALEYDAAHEGARFNLALVLERRGRLAEAAAALAALAPAVPEAGRERIRIEAMMGGVEARRALEAARSSSDPATLAAAAAGFRKAGELEKALALLDRAADLSPRDPHLLSNRGAVRQALGQGDEAAKDFEAAVALDPAHADAHFNLGVLAEERGRLKEALDRYASAIRARPAFAPAHNNVGVLYLKVNQLGKAVECFRRAVEADPDFAAARLNLGWAYLSLDRKDQALEELKAYVARTPRESRDAAAIETIAKLEGR